MTANETNNMLLDFVQANGFSSITECVRRAVSAEDNLRNAIGILNPIIDRTDARRDISLEISKAIAFCAFNREPLVAAVHGGEGSNPSAPTCDHCEQDHGICILCGQDRDPNSNNFGKRI